ncbi:hypothetical protein GCM10017784_30560 [Deinococcus indicus]|uniref:hypothetical protein n=1 Tax=Deinococcus indicus TaxID=223556 RepID=UPI00174C0C5A|nr:hypothetical protein [Deinococcus indicus]GHG34583.1 hypothetical protein GCM10017784_30560 [Deinococcus indicus]
MKLLLALGMFALASAAASLTTYTLTVKVSPAQPDTQILVYSTNSQKAKAQGFSCSTFKNNSKVGNTLTCKLNKDTYKIYVSGADFSFDSTEKTINLDKNMTVIMAVNPKKKSILSNPAKAAFNKLLIKITGSLYSCNGYANFSDELCATVALDQEMVKRWVNLTPEMVQTTAWSDFGGTGSYANFQIGGQKQLLMIGTRKDGLTFLRFSVGSL